MDRVLGRVGNLVMGEARQRKGRGLAMKDGAGESPMERS